MEKIVRGFHKMAVCLAQCLSRLGAAALLVEFNFVFEAIVQFKVVVLQSSGGARRQAAVGAGAVQEEAGANRPQ